MNTINVCLEATLDRMQVANVLRTNIGDTGLASRGREICTAHADHSELTQGGGSWHTKDEPKENGGIELDADIDFGHEKMCLVPPTEWTGGAGIRSQSARKHLPNYAENSKQMSP